MFNIVLHEPEKPDNTGNIGRTCVVTGTRLHLIYPLGFQLTKEKIHHAGLDYWKRLNVVKHDSYNDFLKYLSEERNMKLKEYKNANNILIIESEFSPMRPNLWFATTKGHKSYTDAKFNDGDYIMFGKESAGIPETILANDEEHCIRIPMANDERSLNLANSVAIVLYEALRQNDFLNLSKKGELHNLKYE